eukprot:4136294-Prymnesium_polylepis.1
MGGVAHCFSVWCESDDGSSGPPLGFQSGSREARYRLGIPTATTSLSGDENPSMFAVFSLGTYDSRKTKH